jgi:methionyl aminopeptidase
MRTAGLVVARVLAALEEHAAPGVTTRELDLIARDMLAEAKAASSFLGYGAAFGLPPYPAVTCISVNDEIVHGIPGDRVLAAGDLVSVDFGASVAGWHGDSARTFGVGRLTDEAAQLSEVTRVAMWDGIAAGRVGGRVGDISHAVESSIDGHEHPYGIVAEYTGHGIGTAMHQDPDVPNYGRAGRGERIRDGVCLAIEPMVTFGSAEAATLNDEWTVVTRDRSLAAHWEHSVAYTDAGVWVLTAEDGGKAELAARGVPFAPLAD